MHVRRHSRPQPTCYKYALCSSTCIRYGGDDQAYDACFRSLEVHQYSFARLKYSLHSYFIRLYSYHSFRSFLASRLGVCLRPSVLSATVRVQTWCVQAPLEQTGFTT